MNLPEFCETCEDLGLARSATRLGRYLEHLDGQTQLKGKRILDVGGGKGTLSFFVAAVGGAREVVCMEPVDAGSEPDAEERFHEARLKFKLDDRVLFCTETLQTFEKPDPKFDLILLHNSINHLNEEACVNLRTCAEAYDSYVGLAKKLADLCAEGGEIIICDCSSSNLFGTLGMANPFAPTIEWHKHQTPEVWMSVMGEAGFRPSGLKWSPFVWLPNVLGRLTQSRLISWALTSHFCIRMQRPESV